MASRTRTRSSKPRALSTLRTRRAPKGVGKITSPQELRMLERRRNVWSLRKQGYSLDEIAVSLGCSPETVRDDIVTIAGRLATELSETVEESRQLQLVRLDAMLKKYQGLAEAGSLAAASMVLSIEARRSKLLALDMPEQKKLEVTGIREYVGIDLSKV